MRTTILTSILTCVALAALSARAADTTYERHANHALCRNGESYNSLARSAYSITSSVSR
jgi:hypothetical protein